MTGIGIRDMIKFANNKKFQEQLEEQFQERLEEQLERDRETLFRDYVVTEPEPDVEPVSAADTDMATIDLRKEEPDVAHLIYKKNFVLKCFNSRDPEHVSDTFDVYTDNCTGFEFKGGNVHLDFDIDSVTFMCINGRKRLVRGIDIDYWVPYQQTCKLGKAVGELSYHVEFKHIEMEGARGDLGRQKLTLVYKLLECIS